MSKVVAARRGRPRAFDRDDALRQAMQLFWERGFAGTSMVQLVEAMGINTPSIYAAYGSKEDLFREAVELYVATDGSSTPRALTQELNTRTAIEVMLKDAVRTFSRFDTPRGCLIVLGGGHLADGDDSIRNYLRAGRARIREQIHARLVRGVAEGDLAADAPVEAMAAMYMAFLNGLSVETADGLPETVLLEAVDALLRDWLVD